MIQSQKWSLYSDSSDDSSSSGCQTSTSQLVLGDAPSVSPAISLRNFYKTINPSRQELANLNIWLKRDKPWNIYKTCQNYLQELGKNKKCVNQSSRRSIGATADELGGLLQKLEEIEQKIIYNVDLLVSQKENSKRRLSLDYFQS